MKLFYITALSLGVSLATPLRSQVVGWGLNTLGAVTGNPSTGCATGLVNIAGDTLCKPNAVAAGEMFGLVLKDDGTVFGWGWNYYGQSIGYGTPEPSRTNGPVVLAGKRLKDVVAIAAAENLGVALKNDGTVVTWGAAALDQPNGQPLVAPISVQGSNFTAIAAGLNHVLVLSKHGTVESYGKGNLPPYGLSNVVAVSATAGDYGNDLALKNDGTVVAWPITGVNRVSPTPSGLSNIVAIAAGWNHNLALTKDGRIFGWGYNASGGATGIPTTNSPYVSSGLVTIGGVVLSNITMIAAGDEYSLAVNKFGELFQWGEPRYYGKWLVPAGLSNVIAIATSRAFCLAITTNAAVAERFRR